MSLEIDLDIFITTYSSTRAKHITPHTNGEPLLKRSSPHSLHQEGLMEHLKPRLMGRGVN